MDGPARMITSDQWRGARAMLGMTREQLAATSGISAVTIHRVENDASTAQPATLGALRRTLERAGITFLADDGRGGPGLRLSRATVPAGGGKIDEADEARLRG